MIELSVERFAAVRARARNRCQLCGVANWAMGGRDRDARFHPIWPGDEGQAPALIKPGARAWCGKDGPEHLLRVERIVCEVVSYFHCATPDDEDLIFACRRCRAAHPHWPVVVRFPDREEAIAWLASEVAA